MHAPSRWIRGLSRQSHQGSHAILIVSKLVACQNDVLQCFPLERSLFLLSHAGSQITGSIPEVCVLAAPGLPGACGYLCDHRQRGGAPGAPPVVSAPASVCNMLPLGVLGGGLVHQSVDQACTARCRMWQVLEQDRAPALFNLVFSEGIINDATTVAVLRTVQARLQWGTANAPPPDRQVASCILSSV